MNILLASAILFLALCFAVSNLILRANGGNRSDGGRPYRVEINRIEADITEKGPSAVRLSEYEYVTSVTQFDSLSDAIKSDEDFVVKEIGGKYYRFAYFHGEKDDAETYYFVNGILAAVSVFVILLLLYVRGKIIKPFNRLSAVPYELSRGNLTAPVKYEKNQFFGKFVWGVDLLRVNIEQQKARELELQKEKKTMILSLSHDIKTPLSAIKLYARAISAELYADIKKQSEIADAINRKADEIEQYICEIIKTANEDLFKFDVNNRDFYLSEMINAIDVYYSEKLSLIHTAFRIEPYTDCLLNGDVDRGIEVLQNILENAVKYGDGKEIVISFAEEDGCRLISVRNSGTPLPESEFPHIFESFYRGSNTDGKPGSGLGLNICRQLMHKMKGEVFAEAQPDGIKVTAVFAKA